MKFYHTYTAQYPFLIGSKIMKWSVMTMSIMYSLHVSLGFTLTNDSRDKYSIARAKMCQLLK